MRHSCLTHACLLLIVLSLSLSAQPSVPWIISTVAGINPVDEGVAATSGWLDYPTSVVLDRKGVIYFIDSGTNRLRKIQDGKLTTLVNRYFYALALDSQGTLYGSDYSGVYLINGDGNVTRIAGQSSSGYAGDGELATQAQFSSISSLAIDGQGNIVLLDSNNRRVRRIDRAGVVQTIAGNSENKLSPDGSVAATSSLYYPYAVAVDSAGTVYISDSFGYRIRKIGADGKLAAVAGNGNFGPPIALATGSPLPGSCSAMALDADGGLLFAAGPYLLKAGTDGSLRKVAGTGTYGYSGDGGRADVASFTSIQGIASSGGAVYVSDNGSHRLRVIRPSGIVETFAGASHFSGEGTPAAGAMLHRPFYVAAAKNGDLYVADSQNHRIRKITGKGAGEGPSAIAGDISTVAGTGEIGFSADGTAATKAKLYNPQAIAIDANGRPCFVDSGNNRVRCIEADGAIRTLAGNGSYGDPSDNTKASATSLRCPSGLAFDASGNLYLGDDCNYRVWRVDTNGFIFKFAGNGERQYAGDGGLAIAAGFKDPRGLAIAKDGSLYVADPSDYRVRRIAPNGIVSTVAGIGQFGFPQNGAVAASSPAAQPIGVAADDSGNVFFTNPYNNALLQINAVGKVAVLTRCCPSSPGLGDGLDVSGAVLSNPTGLAVDAKGNVFIGDVNNNRIRRLTANTPEKLEIAGGNNQRAQAGKDLPEALKVRLLGRLGTGVAGWTVEYEVTTGTATLSAKSTITGSDGVAGVGLKLGSTAGPVVVVAKVTGVASVTFNITATATDPGPGPGVPRPVISDGGIALAGLSVPAVREISPNSIISIFGSEFWGEPGFRTVGGGDLTGGRLPTRFAGVCVEIGGVRAYPLLVTKGQLNVLVPEVAAGDRVTVQVIRNCGDATEVKSEAATIAVRAVTPEFFYGVRGVDGKDFVAALNAITYAYVLPSAPAKPGDIVSLWGTGFGATNPATPVGALASVPARTAATVRVRLGDRDMPDSAVVYSGVAPGLSGVYQLNLKVPEDLPDGDYAVSLRLGDQTAPTAWLRVKK